MLIVNNIEREGERERGRERERGGSSFLGFIAFFYYQILKIFLGPVFIRSLPYTIPPLCICLCQIKTTYQITKSLFYYYKIIDGKNSFVLVRLATEDYLAGCPAIHPRSMLGCFMTASNPMTDRIQSFSSTYHKDNLIKISKHFDSPYIIQYVESN